MSDLRTTPDVWIDCDPANIQWSFLQKAKKEGHHLGISYSTLISKPDALFAEITKALDTPVIKGYDAPLSQSLQNGSNQESPIAKMQETLNNASKFWIMTIGPLTNIAAFLSCTPDIREKLEGIVIVGGGVYRGDVLPSVEGSFAADPEAASIVIHSGLPVYLIPFEMKKALHGDFHFEDLVWEKAFVDIDLWGKSTRGASVVDFNSKITGRKTNVFVLTGVGKTRLQHGHV